MKDSSIIRKYDEATHAKYLLGQELMLKPKTKASGLYILGGMYKDGCGVPPDHEAYIDMFYKAAELGHAGAALDLCSLYATGNTRLYITPNLNKALLIIDLVLCDPNNKNLDANRDGFSQVEAYGMLEAFKCLLEMRLGEQKPDNM